MRESQENRHRKCHGWVEWFSYFPQFKLYRKKPVVSFKIYHCSSLLRTWRISTKSVFLQSLEAYTHQGKLMRDSPVRWQFCSEAKSGEHLIAVVVLYNLPDRLQGHGIGVELVWVHVVQRCGLGRVPWGDGRLTHTHASCIYVVIQFYIWSSCNKSNVGLHILPDKVFDCGLKVLGSKPNVYYK